MDELDHDYSIHTRFGAGDDKLYVAFRMYYSPDVEASEEAARPKFRDEVYIRILTPGDRNNIIDRPMRPEDKFRFPKQWAMYQSGEKELGSGTRLEEWSPMPRSMVEELRYFGFRTVEHVAEANDAVMGKMPGLREWSLRAKRFLEATADKEQESKLQSELSKRDAQIAVLADQLQQLLKVAKVPEGSKDVAQAAKDHLATLAPDARESQKKAA